MCGEAGQRVSVCLSLGGVGWVGGGGWDVALAVVNFGLSNVAKVILLMAAIAARTIRHK